MKIQSSALNAKYSLGMLGGWSPWEKSFAECDVDKVSRESELHSLILSGTLSHALTHSLSVTLSLSITLSHTLGIAGGWSPWEKSFAECDVDKVSMPLRIAYRRV